MAIGKAHINGEMLKWARNEASLSLQAVAEVASISGVRGKTGAQRIQEWETRETLPSKNQLAKLAKTYVQPTLLFYLSSPPEQDEVLPDFRKLPSHDDGISPKLKALVARTRARQDEIIDILTEDENDPPAALPFIGRFTIQISLQEFVVDLRRTLGVTEADQRKHRNNDALFRVLRSKAEDLGIYVLLQGDLGSYHSRIDPIEFRGFCIANPVAPFVVLNSYDAKPAQSFTLIHELAHLWLNESGISNLNPFDNQSNEVKIETICNKVASHFLMPPASLLQVWQNLSGIDPYQAINEVAKEFSVSRRAVAYRLRLENQLEFNTWRQLTLRFQHEYERSKAKQKETDSGPSRYVIQRYQLGKRFVKTVLGALDTGVLGYTSASRILGVPSKGFPKIRPDAR